MRVVVKQGSITEEQCDVIIVNLFAGVTQPGGATGAVDGALGGAVTKQIKRTEFKGAVGDVLVIPADDRLQAKHVIVVGLGERAEFDIRAIMRASAAAIRKCQDLNARSVAGILHGAGIGGLPVGECTRATVLGSILAEYRFDEFKTNRSGQSRIEMFSVVEQCKENLDIIALEVDYSLIAGEAITFTRDLNNSPSNVVTPDYLAEVAKGIADESGMDCRVLGRHEIETVGMGLLAAVARGSEVEPKFIEMRYTSPDANRTFALIGKGVTFDTGGYSLKPSESMYGMKDDMSGAGAVLGVMKAISVLKPSVNIIALIPATENCIGGSAIHPGDVFTSLSGQTVEVNNTDAEGRLILADAITYALNLGVDEIIDCATLTGACTVALGTNVSGVFGNNDSIVDRLISAGNTCGEELWRLPLVRDYAEELTSDIADMKNTGSKKGGAITGALFLEKFIGGMPWTHIDLSSATVDKDTPMARKGATGVPVGTLVEYFCSSCRSGARG